MYGGITQGLFPVTRVVRLPDLLSYEVELSAPMVEGLGVGASVAVNGVCQTVTAIAGERVSFDAIVETLRLTNLGELVVGSRVSVERSLRFGQEIGGHELAGHIVGTGTVCERQHAGNDVSLWVSVPAAWAKYILPKGFIAVEGSSLTVGRVSRDAGHEAMIRFSLHLIPETLRLTRLGDLAIGSKVNIELDARTVAIVETVERVLAQREAALEHG